MLTGTHRKPTRYSIRDAGDAIRRRETFLAGDGSLAGGYVSRDNYPIGRLPASVLDVDYAHALNSSDALYLVRSYGTPIAWAAPGEPLTVPDVRYSVTTTRHQNIARRADV